MLLFGYEIGAIAWVVLTFQSYAMNDDDSFRYYEFVNQHQVLLGIIASGSALGAALCYPFLLYIGNGISKKDEIMLASLTFFAGGFLQSLAGDLNWNEPWGLLILIIGRLVVGCGIAATLHSVPQYVSEVVPSDWRGQLGSLTESTVMTGVILGFCVAYSFEKGGGETGSWSFTFTIFYVLSIVMGLLSLLLPNSPVWMIHCEYPKGEVMNMLRFVYLDATDEALHDLIAVHESEKKAHDEQCAAAGVQSRRNVWAFLPPDLYLASSNEAFRHCLIVLIIFNFFRIFVGQNFIIYFSSLIFSEVYSNSNYIEHMIVIMLGCRAAAAYVMVCFADWFGRRDYMVVTCVAMFLSLFMSSIGFFTNTSAVVTIGIASSGIFFEMGFGSLSYLLMNELVPYNLRSSANAIANFMQFCCFFTLNFLGPYMISGVGCGSLFLLFACVNLVAAFFFHYYLPETRGIDMERSYLQVSKKLTEGPHVRMFAAFAAVDCRCCGGGGDVESEAETRALIPKDIL